MMEKQLKFLWFKCVGWGKHRVGNEAVVKLPDLVTSGSMCNKLRMERWRVTHLSGETSS